MTILKDGTLIIPMTTRQTILTDARGHYAGSNKDIYVLRSTDGGVTFTKVLIGPNNSPAAQGPGGFFGLGNLVSGPDGTGERIYLTYSAKQPKPTPATLMLVTSVDKGVTWSAPRAIVTTSSNGGGVGSMSVMMNSRAVLGIQYYRVVNSTFDMYFTYSTDRGATFSTPTKVTTASSRDLMTDQPRVPGQDQVYTEAGPDGKFYMVWQL
jgi:hypothetical protein